MNILRTMVLCEQEAGGIGVIFVNSTFNQLA